MMIKRWVWPILLLLLPILWTGCVRESNYESATGTWSIPWGESDGQRNPEEAWTLQG